MFEKDEKTLVKAIGIILVFILGGLASTFFVTAIKPISGNSQFSRKRLRVYTIVVFSFIRTFAPSF